MSSKNQRSSNRENLTRRELLRNSTAAAAGLAVGAAAPGLTAETGLRGSAAGAPGVVAVAGACAGADGTVGAHAARTTAAVVVAAILMNSRRVRLLTWLEAEVGGFVSCVDFVSSAMVFIGAPYLH